MYSGKSHGNAYLITTTITLSIPEERIAECIGLPAVPDGSPSSLDRYWSPTWDAEENNMGLNWENHVKDDLL